MSRIEYKDPEGRRYYTNGNVNSRTAPGICTSIVCARESAEIRKSSKWGKGKLIATVTVDFPPTQTTIRRPGMPDIIIGEDMWYPVVDGVTVVHGREQRNSNRRPRLKK